MNDSDMFGDIIGGMMNEYLGLWPLYIMLAITAGLIVFVVILGVTQAVMEKERKNLFLKRYGEDHTVITLKHFSYETEHDFVIYAVNGMAPWGGENRLHVPYGENIIFLDACKAVYRRGRNGSRYKVTPPCKKTDTKWYKPSYIKDSVNALLGSPERAKNCYVLELDIKRGWKYELRYDAYESELEVVIENGDEHKVKRCKKMSAKPRYYVDAFGEGQWE